MDRALGRLRRQGAMRQVRGHRPHRLRVLVVHEVGMLRALAETGIEPDVVLGTSVGAINGAFYAADPTIEGVDRLTSLWRETGGSEMSAGLLLRRVTTLARTGTHLQSLS